MIEIEITKYTTVFIDNEKRSVLIKTIGMVGLNCYVLTTIIEKLKTEKGINFLDVATYKIEFK